MEMLIYMSVLRILTQTLKITNFLNLKVKYKKMILGYTLQVKTMTLHPQDLTESTKLLFLNKAVRT
jgi:hypothetical protein